MPSNRNMRAEVVRLLQRFDDDAAITELGSGWGGLSRDIALTFPEKRVTGVEISPAPFLWSKLMQAFMRVPNLRFKRGNILAGPLQPGHTYVCYLSTMHMKKLAEKIEGEGFKGLFVSIEFAFHGKKPLQTVKVNDFYGSIVYTYRFD